MKFVQIERHKHENCVANAQRTPRFKYEEIKIRQHSYSSIWISWNPLARSVRWLNPLISESHVNLSHLCNAYDHKMQRSTEKLISIWKSEQTQNASNNNNNNNSSQSSSYSHMCYVHISMLLGLRLDRFHRTFFGASMDRLGEIVESDQNTTYARSFDLYWNAVELLFPLIPLHRTAFSRG